MNKTILGGIKVSDTAPTDGQGLIYRTSSGVYAPEDISGGGSSSQIFNEKELSAGDITAGYKDMQDPFPSWVTESASGGYGTRAFFGKVVYFNNYYRIYAGFKSGSGASSDSYRSSDGITWSFNRSIFSDLEPAYNIAYHCVEVFNNKVYIMAGGYIWESSDGDTFARLTSANCPNMGNNAASCVFDGKLWLLGGSAAGTSVYYSSDATTWTLATSSPGWSSRQHFSAVVKGSEMFIIGGFNQLNDVWKSSNGTSWSQVTASAGWGGRTTNHQVIVKDDKFWLAGGLGGATYYNDYWY